MASKLQLMSCVASCALLFACAGSGQSVRTTPSNVPAVGGAMDDATITARVKTVLLNDPQVAATKIEVSTAAGIVTLSGSVKSKADEARAIQVARTVTGVRDVKSTLVLPAS
jgi:hyperosmotically inducible periplasmic protein